MSINSVDFNNSEIAFQMRSNDELKQMNWLFKMMNKPWLVNWGSRAGLLAIRLRLPFVKKVLKNTVYRQFCAGETLLDSKPVIERMGKYHVKSILDYGAEGKETEADFNFTMNNTIRSIDFSEEVDNIPVVSIKITGLARFNLLEKVHNGDSLTVAEQKEFEGVRKRLEAICYNGHQKNIQVYIDAEETWIQNAVDELAYGMMKLFNKEKAIVFNTYQLYTTTALASMKKGHELAQKEGYIFGSKIVRGAYIDKERERAAAMGYPSPIQPDKPATDRDFNLAIKYAVENIGTMSLCCATHNSDSCHYYAQLLDEAGISHQHPHVMFSQLYGMSDNLTFNLGNAGYNASKYLPYGPVFDVVPYLIRRAQENTSVTGEMSREFEIINTEIKRRGIS
jgi:proline dehydrogenase